MSNKHLMDFIVVSTQTLANDAVVLRLTPAQDELPPISGGQFVNILVDNSPTTFLRRPISVNYVDYENNELWLLVKPVGDGTRSICASKPGRVFSILLPLGNGFSMPEKEGSRVLLVGGGVGIAPLLYWGAQLKQAGHKPEFLLGGRTAADITQTELFNELGATHICTEDGSNGLKGMVTAHPVLVDTEFSSVQCCGPLPMMKAVAKVCAQTGVDCEVSLENKMACGLGACLCCVEDTQHGHECVCTKGPVFNTKELKW